jgi:adenylate cyclase
MAKKRQKKAEVTGQVEMTELMKKIEPQEQVKKRKILFIPIGFKMISITSLIVIASLAGVAIAASFFFRSDNEVRAMEDTLRLSTLISKKVKSDLLAIVDKTRMTLININESGNALKSKSRQKGMENTVFADVLFRRDPDLYYIAVIKKGEGSPQMEFRNREAVQGINLGQIISSEKQNFDRAFKGDEVLMNLSVYLKSPAVGVAVPFEIVEGRESIMMVIFSMERVMESIRSEGVVKSFIVSGQGDVIAHYDSSVTRSKVNLSSLGIVKLMISSANPNGQTFFNDEKGERHLGAFRRIGFTDAAVLSTVPEKTAFAAVYKIQRIILFITVTALGSAVLLILVFSKTLTRPIERLMNAAKSIRKGDFTVVVPATTRDEIGKLSASFTEMAHGLAEREKMKDAFGKFVNKEVAEMVLKGELKLGGERKDVAVFFSDIRSFTAISEKLEPEEVVEFLNEYMTIMVDCVNKTHGSVDKFIGDAIMAVWGAPISYGNDTENAVNGALMMRTALLKFNKGRGGDKKPVIRIGSGINTGPVLAGQIGSQEKMEYTVIGDTVNLASRIESLNKPFGTDILISEDAYELVKDLYVLEPMKKIKVKGKTEPQQIFAVIKRKDDPHGPSSLDELRELVGIEFHPDEPASRTRASDGEDEEKEVKYEIIE